MTTFGKRLLLLISFSEVRTYFQIGSFNAFHILFKMFHFYLKLTLALLLFSLHVNGQQYYFRHYQVENGLSNNTVFSTAQDKQGFMWFGTKEGLNRFDGYRFKLYHLDDNAEQTLDLIYNIYPDKRGTLWIGSQKGLYYFDAANEKLRRFNDTLREVWALQSDAQGQLWFLSQNRLCRYNFTTKKLRIFTIGNRANITSACITASGDIWASDTDGFLQRLDTTTGAFTPFPVFDRSLPMPSCYIHRIMAAGNRIMVCTSCQGLKEFDTQTKICRGILTYNADHTNVYVHDILQDSENEFWVASESGIYLVNTATGKTVNMKKKSLDPYSLNDNAIYALCKDREGGLWVGTYFGGVNYRPREYSPIRKYYPDYSPNSLSGSAVREIHEDKDGQLWIGTEDAGLNRLNPQTGAITHYTPLETPNSITYSNIHGILVNGDEVWAGTHEHGLDVINRHTGKLLRHYKSGNGPHDLPNSFVVTILKTSKNDIYIGTGNGMVRYNPATDSFDQIPGMPRGFSVSNLMEDHAGVLWGTCHQQGLLSYNPGTGKVQQFFCNPDNRNSIGSNTLNASLEDHTHNIWFACEGGGLTRLSPDRKTFTRFTTKDGLPSEFIFKIVEDNRQTLWVTTSRGLAHLDINGKVLQVYTRANGLLNDQFNYNSGYKDAAGRLYFGSIRGMISFNPAEFTPNTFEPPVYLTGFQVHNKELAISEDSSALKKSVLFTDEITLKHDASSFSIDFAALSYNAPEITAYKYIMEGLDRDWTDLRHNRKVYFTNLASGKYTFRIKASTNGRWGKEARLTVHILPPFWATTWAYLLYSVIASMIGYYVISFYHKRTQIKKEKEIYEAKIDFFTNVTHEIRTPLTLIKGPVENLLEKSAEVPDIKPDVTTLERNTNRLIALITQILDFRQTEARGFSLNFSDVRIDRLLQEEFEDFAGPARKKKLQYRLSLPDKPVEARADEEALHKIVSNLLSNAVKYGTTTVDVILHPVLQEDDNFTVEVRNDGHTIPADMQEKIFEPFYRMKETNRQTGSGIGLSIARSLAELHKGSLRLQNYNDGVNVFILNLPLKPEHKQPKSTKNTKTATK